MGKKAAGKKKGGGGGGGGSGSAGGFSTLDVDPRRVRFAHSKIKPLFSGCGRTIEQTMCEIRAGATRACDLPMITVLLGLEDPVDGQQCLFSLNNRRLFVFKACREEGLLGPSGLIRVRVRAMKVHERERYTPDRCSLQAKFLFAPNPVTLPAVALTATELVGPAAAAVAEADLSSSSAATATASRRAQHFLGQQREEEDDKEAGERKAEGCRVVGVEAGTSGSPHKLEEAEEEEGGEGEVEEEDGPGVCNALRKDAVGGDFCTVGHRNRMSHPTRATSPAMAASDSGGEGVRPTDGHGRRGEARDLYAGGRRGRRKGRLEGGGKRGQAGVAVEAGLMLGKGVESLASSRKQERSRKGRRDRHG